MTISRHIAAFLAAASFLVPVAAHGASPADSLFFPGEVDTLTHADLRTVNVNTLNDILALAPGVSWWLGGSPASATGFSIDGRPTGAALFVDGAPFVDPWDGEALSRFIPFSRIERVEIVHSSSPLATGRCGAGGAVDVILERGGRQGPFARADFTYGKSDRRARRVWFSTPRGPLSLVVAYDEYLQDAFVADPERPSFKIGEYDGRSTLLGLRIETEAGDVVDASLHRYEEAHVTVDYAPSPADVDETRRDGFDTRLSWSRGTVAARVRQRSVERIWPTGRVSSMLVAGEASWDNQVGGCAARFFARVEDADADVTIGGVTAAPAWRVFEGGVTGGSAIAGGLRWRGGVHGGVHDEAGAYLGGEAGIAREAGGWTQSVLVARRLRVPDASELFAPAADPSGKTPLGSTALEPAVVDEIAAGAGQSGRLFAEVFARRSSDLPVAGGVLPGVFSATGRGETIGARCRARGAGSVPGFAAAWALSGSYLFEKNGHVDGVPVYGARLSTSLSRAVFKETETIRLGAGVTAWGERSWGEETLDGFVSVDLSGSLTILGAIVRVELRNALDTDAETVPGYLMPPRYWSIGLLWDFFD